MLVLIAAIAGFTTMIQSTRARRPFTSSCYPTPLSAPRLIAVRVVATVVIGSSFAAWSLDAHSLTLDGVPASQSEVALMSPVCRLITVERRGIHHGAGSGPKQEHRPIFEKPEYRLAAANPHLHHYCWSEIRMLRYFRAKNSAERERLYDQVLSDIDYVLSNTDKGWPYFHLMLLKQAQMMYYHGRYESGLRKVEEALAHKGDYDRAYALRSDIHAMMGNKKLAIQASLDGIVRAPESPVLRKQLARLGVPEVAIQEAIRKHAHVDSEASASSSEIEPPRAPSLGE